jgi:hypothetical protein
MNREIFNRFWHGGPDPLGQYPSEKLPKGVRPFAEIGRQPIMLCDDFHVFVSRKILQWSKEFVREDPIRVLKSTFMSEVFGPEWEKTRVTSHYVGRIISMNLRYNPSTNLKATKEFPSRPMFVFRQGQDVFYAMLVQLSWRYLEGQGLEIE